MASHRRSTRRQGREHRHGDDAERCVSDGSKDIDVEVTRRLVTSQARPNRDRGFYARSGHLIDQVKDSELTPVNVDVPTSAGIVMGRAPGIVALRADIADIFPKFDLGTSTNSSSTPTSRST
jgi:hypothetical protein